MTRTARILLSASFLALFPLGLLGPIYAIFVREIGGDAFEAGASFAVFSIISGIFIFLLGRWRFFKEHLHAFVVIGYALLTIAELGYLWVDSSLKLFIVQILLGIAGGILEPSWDGLYSANLSAEKAASVWSNWAGGRDLIGGIGAFVGGAIVAAYSFTVLFIVMAIFNIAAVFVSLRLLKNRKQSVSGLL